MNKRRITKRKSIKKAKLSRRVNYKQSNNKKIKLRNNKIQLYNRNKLQTDKHCWISVSDGYIYISTKGSTSCNTVCSDRWWRFNINFLFKWGPRLKNYMRNPVYELCLAI